MITLRQSEDECLIPIGLVRKYMARTKDREQRNEKLFLTWKMGLATAVSDAKIASLLKETLNLPNIRASVGSARKCATSYVASQETQSKQLWK